MTDAIDPRLNPYLDALLAHAETALWPERRLALESFYRGIAGSAPADLEALIAATGIAVPEGAEPAVWVFRVVVTAYLKRLGEAAVTNPDQAVVFGWSLDERHRHLGAAWFAAHPEHREE